VLFLRECRAGHNRIFFGDETVSFRQRDHRNVYAEVRRHFFEVETANLTYAIALRSAFNRIAVGLRRERARG
jgi:alkylhydroperoxidase family enzyme